MRHRAETKLLGPLKACDHPRWTESEAIFALGRTVSEISAGESFS
jgi:hypothetical protein